MREELEKIIPEYMLRGEILLALDSLIYDGVDEKLIKRAFSRFHKLDGVIKKRVHQAIEAYARRVERKDNE